MTPEPIKRSVWAASAIDGAIGRWMTVEASKLYNILDQLTLIAEALHQS